MTTSNTSPRGPIGWMATNPVAANILMLFFLLGGAYWGTQIKQEVFPEFDRDEVTVRVSYPGASPGEVADGIVLPVEEAISSLDGIEEIKSTAVEGRGTIRVEAMFDTDLQQLATDIKNEVDRISSFPSEAEEPSVTVPVRRRSVITLVLYGDLSPSVLRESAELVRDQLLQDKGISQVDLQGERALEISIDISQESLRTFGISLREVADRIRTASLDLPGGTIKASSGHVQLRMKERRDLGREFEDIPILTTEDGSQVLLGDIAVVNDGFAETDYFMTYNNLSAIGIEVFRVGDQGPIEIADSVRRHAERLAETLPEGIKVDTVNDRSVIYKQRLNLLMKNGYLGLALILILLGVFLEPRLAFWVTMGIPVSFLGSLLFLPTLNVSINMVSLFAFIVSLGIVVDDTIIVGENIYSYRQKGYSNLEAAIKGAREMAAPVTFAVLTNIITFMPLYFIPGVMGKIFRNIPLVVATVFFISLIEAVFVLPAHLAHQKPLTGRFGSFMARIQARVSNGISRTIENVFTPSVRLAMRYRYVSLAIGIMILVITGAYVKSGHLGMTLFPRVESDRAMVSFSLPVGVPVEQTTLMLNRLQRAAEQVTAENGGSQLVQGTQARVDSNTGWIRVYLTPPNVRPISTSEFTKLWRKASGRIPGLESLRFRANSGGPGSGANLTVELQHRDSTSLELASSDLALELNNFPIVNEIEDGFQKGKEQYDFQLNPAGYRLGLTPESVARQVRASYYGYEIVRQLRGRNEIKAMVRLPTDERRSFLSLANMVIRTQDGGEVPLQSVVTITPGHAFNDIQQRDGRRIVQVTAEVTPESQADQVIAVLKEEILPRLQQQYPGLNFSFEGKQADRKNSLASLQKSMIISLLIVYVLLSVIFRSYVQPAIIMVAIPFGVVGAVLGHMLMGYSLSIVSFFGIVALSGVVVNDSLVLIDLTNRKRLQGDTSYAAVINAAVARFRPIILTTLTTFFGLLPMIFETSRQARFLIPMAISLGFGILFATAITLVLVPSMYLILEDAKTMLGINQNLPIDKAAKTDDPGSQPADPM